MSWSASTKAPGSEKALAQTYLLLLLTILFWGGTAVAGKFLLQDVPPLTAGVFRYGGTVLLLLLLFRHRLPAPRALPVRDRWLLVWIGIVGTFLNHIGFFVGLVFAPATHASLITNTTSPVWATLLAVRLGRERLARLQAVGLALCGVGVLLVMHPAQVLSGQGLGVLVGDGLFILVGLSWGVYSYLSTLVMRRLAPGITLTFGMAVGTLCLIPTALIERPWATVRFAHAAAWAGLAFLIVACTLLSYLWWNMALAKVGASRTAVFSNLVPLVGILLAWLFLGERLAPIQLLGGLLAVAGVVACQRSGARGPGRLGSHAREQRPGGA